jgi:hypothetical protein
MQNVVKCNMPYKAEIEMISLQGSRVGRYEKLPAINRYLYLDNLGKRLFLLGFKIS